MQSVDSADRDCSCGDLFAVTAWDSDPCYELTFAEEVENGKQIADTDAGEPISNAELLRLDVDVLIPAAVAHAITEEVAEELRADVVVEAANGPTTPAADDGEGVSALEAEYYDER